MLEYHKLYDLVNPQQIYNNLVVALHYTDQFRNPFPFEVYNEIQFKIQLLISNNLLDPKDDLSFPGYEPWRPDARGLPLFHDFNYDMSGKEIGKRVAINDEEEAIAITQRNQYLFNLEQSGWPLHSSDKQKIRYIRHQKYDNDIHPKRLIAIGEISDNRTEHLLHVGITRSCHKDWIVKHELYKLASEQVDYMIITRNVNRAMDQLKSGKENLQSMIKWFNLYFRDDPDLGLVVTEEMQNQMAMYQDIGLDKLAKKALTPPAQRGK